MFTVPAVFPRAASLLTARLPPRIVTFPLKELAEPVSRSVPLLVFARLPAPPTAPATVHVPAGTSMPALPESVSERPLLRVQAAAACRTPLFSATPPPAAPRFPSAETLSVPLTVVPPL